MAKKKRKPSPKMLGTGGARKAGNIFSNRRKTINAAVSGKKKKKRNGG